MNEKIVKGTSVMIIWGSYQGKRGRVINEYPAELGNDLVEIKLNEGICICLERKHLQEEIDDEE
ncbi:MAG: hypothetical protein A2626_02860 [Candidatus Nealsonbacteria bacterium RIFCSPHIGHO2_01_FULL_38_55]|uniref:KOW domain-containing protein n=2 Tax=Candidatus Nealsoniibacteriota TaxID=1817911 RepID=A0A1G2EGE4_9BACT|nr:MAG: hypothetical protein US88_C0002G0045 [Parcubacteria group bacterium GW2011_GWA2_38_27]OGZ19648.1 MAG: hypothetical protein A2626_02860 [Candidatus Nealsonbacteria bacterium RIFCSPHIGHO2_01_FULL_38_55]OGZ20656.1 MAG: hypothetical protein A2W55_01825 [Candidatus Nealsonbacteria bacterium RIFCSPHIGHO2_02_38_10]OGZ21192.1 MAG: hypothetical protein A3C48_02235 [Candidatus Nealsonbacteria bacterium RIFCSPHIGHO2_02_FULL_38_75]OGZ23135.1 MAG: hypothetical protein A3E18_02465 [Candidatus Nealson